MEEQQQTASPQSQQTSKPKRNIKKPLLVTLLIVVLLVAVGYGVYAWQQSQVSKLNQEVANLKRTQLPQQKYSSYEDCTSNGGVILNTINGQFDACLGGNEDDTGELPQHQAFLQYSAQNLPRLEDIIKVDGDPNNLSDFIKSSDSSGGCPTKLVKEQPSCLVVDMFKVSKDLSPVCIENTGYNNGKTKEVIYP